MQKNDYLRNLEELGLIARMKRLSDSMLYSIRDVYKLKGFDIEPNWHLVMLYLKEHPLGTITEMAEAFHLSQAALVKMTTKMKTAGYIDISTDRHDQRKRQLRLSAKAKKHLPEFEQTWEAGRRSIEDLLKGLPEFLMQLDRMEDLLDLKKFNERILSNISQ